MASDDDSVTSTAVRWCRIEGLADVPLAEAVRTGDAGLLPSAGRPARRYPHLHERQTGLGTRAMAALPLLVGNARSAALLLSLRRRRATSTRTSRPSSPRSRRMVAQAMKRALAFQVQQTTSELLQRSLLPESVPELDGLAMGAYYEPGGSGVDVGGDWYDVAAARRRPGGRRPRRRDGQGRPRRDRDGTGARGAAGLRADRPGAGGACSSGSTCWSPRSACPSRSSRSRTA